MRYQDLNIEDLLQIKLTTLNENTNDFQKQIIVDKFFKYYRSKGFPYYDMSGQELDIEYERYHKYDIYRLPLGGNELQQVMLGLNICNNFHPQMWSVKCRDRLTPMDVFSNDDLFKKALMKRIKMSDSKMSPFNIRKSLKIFSGSQSVSNFRPTIAKFLYETYAKGGVVLDPCMGYGGRLLGASESVKAYYSTDPSIKTFDGNKKLASFINSKNKNIDFVLYNKAFEETEFNLKFDFIFTSPPYFNVEKYSEEPNQSYIKYPTYHEWKNGFLYLLINNSFNLLKDGHCFALNVHGDEIIKDSLDIANSIGFKLITTYKMRLSKICGQGVDKTIEKFKHEPVFIFQKKS